MATDAVFTGSIIVARPIMEVFEYARDPKNIHEWYPFYSKIDEVERGENILSFKITYNRIVSPLMPTFQVDLTEMVPGRRLVYRCLKGGVIFTIEFQPSSSGTVIFSSMSLWSWQAILLGFTIPLSRPFFNDWIAQSLQSFKRNAEGRDAQGKPFVFFSYRRAQAMYTGGRIYDALLQEFGEGFVFRDINSISGGSKWRMSIEKALENCKVVIAHIDDDWEKEIKERINITDVLREELNTALHEGKTFIPVFTSHEFNFMMGERLAKIHNTLGGISSGKGKNEASKINNIKLALKDRQGLLLRRDPDFGSDFQKLVQTVWEIVREESSDPALKRRQLDPVRASGRDRAKKLSPSRRNPRPRSHDDASGARRRRNP